MQSAVYQKTLPRKNKRWRCENNIAGTFGLWHKMVQLQTDRARKGSGDIQLEKKEQLHGSLRWWMELAARYRDGRTYCPPASPCL